MQVIETVIELQKLLKSSKREGITGFVPTMGALHEGHISLIRRAKEECTNVVCSIFVNPTQFNDHKDLEKYPRPIEKDTKMLENIGCDYLFYPGVSEIYPPGKDFSLDLDFGKLDKVLEGYFRPGHFNGMAQVVKRLLDIVGPDKLYMGQKDFQQLTIVRELIKLAKLKVDLIMCETVREPDGLAMSSRNIRLDPKIRLKANVIYNTLLWAQKMTSILPVNEITKKAFSKLEIPDFRPEYFEIVDGFTLEPVINYESHNFVVACIACWGGDVRLIDNIILKKPSSIH